MFLYYNWRVKTMKLQLLMLSMVFVLFHGVAQSVFNPGEIYRDYTYDKGRFGVCGENVSYQTDICAQNNPPVVKRLNTDDLKSAVRAEVYVSIWGGHPGTSEQRFRVNGKEWKTIPQPGNTPETVWCYYRTLFATLPAEIPLSWLSPGSNKFEFTGSRQICNDFGWPFFWVYSFTVRIYYKSGKQHPTGKITSPQSGGTIGNNATLTATAGSANSTIKQVDFIGYYTDFDWEGDGTFLDWHYQYMDGVLTRHIGSATESPYTVPWDTSWLPDQSQPVRIIARIVDENNMCYITDAVNVSLSRTHSVKIFSSNDVPENFSVRTGQRKGCHFNIDSLDSAVSARLILHSWSAMHPGETNDMGINDVQVSDCFGAEHNYSFDTFDLPLNILKTGSNTFYIHSDTHEHAAEVLWPGPAVVVYYSTNTGQSGTTIKSKDVPHADTRDMPKTRGRKSEASYRINCGASKKYEEENGNIWEADHPSVKKEGWKESGGSCVDRGNIKISGTSIPAIYQTEKYGRMNYIFNAENGTYGVALYFAETYATWSRVRIFDVYIQGKKVLDKIDVFKETGGRNIALVKEFSDIEVRNGRLNIEFKAVAEEPEINGIEIYRQR
jgi:hypothetical protein